MYPDLTREEAISIFRHERIRYERCDQEFYFSNIVPERNAWCYEIPLKIVATGCVEHISLLAYNGEDGELYNIKVPTAYLIAQQSGLDVHQENKVIHLELSADPVNWLRDLRSGSQNLDFSVFKAHPGDGYSVGPAKSISRNAERTGPRQASSY